jgi:hypothetical protein
MIDTTKIYTFISEEIYNIIKFSSDIKCMYNDSKKEIYYQIVNSSLNGTYDSNLSVRVDTADKYKRSGYVLEIER